MIGLFGETSNYNDIKLNFVHYISTKEKIEMCLFEWNILFHATWFYFTTCNTVA